MHDKRGGAMMFVGVALSALLGFAGLGVDVANLYSERRATQGMADAAAISGTYADIATPGDLNAVEAAALSEVQRNGFTTGTGNDLQVAIVPIAAQPSPIRPRVEVYVRRQIDLVFLQMFMPNPQQAVAARAIGGWRNLGPMCVIALDETEAGAVTFTGSTVADVSCGVASNSSSTSAIDIAGSATLIANPAQAYGDIDISGSGQLVSNYPPLPHLPRVPDPYAGTTFPNAPTTCDLTGLTVAPNTTQTINPGGGDFKI
ncbi:MAG: pilus assembly protein TadG-related protein [Alphaproteobacteria bacterium]